MYDVKQICESKIFLGMCNCFWPLLGEKFDSLNATYIVSHYSKASNFSLCVVIRKIH